ncbi:glucosidase [soil metagenome]
MNSLTPEHARLAAADAGEEPWRLWGPYVSDRQWGTVREDYSRDGNAWDYFPFEHSHLRAYRWGEDGLGAISDINQRLCLGIAMWNGVDPIIKERLYGLTNEQGNHGEDVKELYYHLDATPTQSYLKFLYKYPQRAYPYGQLREENKKRSRMMPEYELLDTGIFDDDRYWDVQVEYAKAGTHDILMQVTVTNRGDKDATLHLLPSFWYRNTWSWNIEALPPVMKAEGDNVIAAIHHDWDDYRLHCDGKPTLLFCDNETNTRVLYNSPSSAYPKSGINDFVVKGNVGAVNPARSGTKAAAHYKLTVPPHQSQTVKLRLRYFGADKLADPFADFESVFKTRIQEADQYYAHIEETIPTEDGKRVLRQAVAGLIWTKQYFQYDVWQWLHGDPSQPPPPAARKYARNHDWEHLKNSDVISMPDKWEYPWYAAWDLAFHCVPLAGIDPEFAKAQLLLFLKERYMHPNGQLPAYEWNFNDTNPPVHAWACWRVYQIAAKWQGAPDHDFLERCFHKLMLNFNWWVNRKDENGRNVFQGGFLGLDNIGVFDRSKPLPMGGTINQADATGWMAMYSLNLMRIALELSLTNGVYEDMAIKFFEHFLSIASAMTNMAGKGIGLWDDRDEFYYDELILPSGEMIPLRVRSMVGLIPLFAVEVLEPELLARVPKFASRMRWIFENRKDLAGLVSRWYEPGRGQRTLLSLLRGHRMKSLLKRIMDPNEFLSDYGLRSLSKFHKEHPYTINVGGQTLSVDYQPGESTIPDFGGNSNWRGPIWLPMNYLLIESLHKFHHYYGEDFQVPFPVDSTSTVSILGAAREIATRVTRIFLRDSVGRRATMGDCRKHQTDPHFRDLIPFYEYFDADTGRGLGASHQTGWTALVAKLILPMDTVFKDLCNVPTKAEEK